MAIDFLRSKKGIKQVIVVRNDVKMSPAKLAVQVAHASLGAAFKAQKKTLSAWENEGQKKVILSAKSKEELLKLDAKCEAMKLNHALIRDAGLTEIDKGTITCLAIGPDTDDKINKVTGSLPLLK